MPLNSEWGCPHRTQGRASRISAGRDGQELVASDWGRLSIARARYDESQRLTHYKDTRPEAAGSRWAEAVS